MFPEGIQYYSTKVECRSSNYCKYSMTFKSSLYLKLSSKEWREIVEEEGQVKVQRSEQNNGSQLSFLLLFIFKIKPHTGHTSITVL